MKSNFFHSLSFKVAGVIILIELISLATIGSFYITRFSQAVDERRSAVHRRLISPWWRFKCG